MIIFSKNSWHYKFNDFLERKDGPWANALDCKSLCSYFWCTVWNMAAALLFLTLVWGIGTFAGVGVLGEVIGMSLDDSSLMVLSWVWLVGVGAILLFVATFFFVIFLLTLPYIGFLKYKENSVDKHPNIFVEWVKSKKAKVCPMIEFKEK